MKLAVVILSGAGDIPVESLGGRTPLEAAEPVHLASLAECGRVGGVKTLPDGVSPSDEAAVSSILEVDPAAEPPRPGAYLASVLGMDLGTNIGPRDLAFRCDFVNLFEDTVVDPTAGRIGGEEAEILFATLDDLDHRRSLLVLNLLFGLVYLPWQFIHVRALRADAMPADDVTDLPQKVTWRVVEEGVRESVHTPNRKTDAEAWGGVVGLMWMFGYWATLIPIWVHHVVGVFSTH